MSTRTNHLAVAAAGPSPSRCSDRPRVLITEGDNVGVIAMVRGLRCAGYEPWVATVRRGAPAARSRSTAGVAIVPDPGHSRAAFTRSIADLAGAIEPVAILPGGEKGMLALADLPEVGPLSRQTVAVCDREVVYRATDKAALIDLAAEVGLAAPETFQLSAEEAAATPLPLPPPVVVKPLRSAVPSNGGFRACGVRLAANREQAIAALRACPGERGLLQPYHRGPLSSLAGVFRDGEVVAAVYQRAVRMWPTAGGQMAFAVALARDPEFELRIGRLLKEIGWAGLFQVQFIETEAGRLLIDLNPRVYGSLSLALAAGQNLPAVWVDSLLGRPIEPTPYLPGVSFRNEVLDTCSLLAGARSARPRTLLRGLAARASSYAFFAVGDPMPLLALGPTIASKLRSRALYFSS
jgi:predicted ATP-grasp superfamily ATP-dependent carboligase